MQLNDKDECFLGRWRGSDTTGKESSLIKLIVLGSLQYLGRGLKFDDLEEYTVISEDVHQVFFHMFINYGKHTLFPAYVVPPANKEELEKSLHKFEQAGFHGAGWSSVATHVYMERCSNHLRNAHQGHKMPFPARIYNISVNNCHMIFSSTLGHPAQWNDKTLVFFDDFLCGVKEG
eukprot:4645917-Ditylum_brightwellii.AAC.1